VIAALLPPAAAAPISARILEVRSYAGFHSQDYSTQGAGDTLGFAGARASLAVGDLGPARLRVDGLVGAFSDGPAAGAGAARVYTAEGRWRFGASAGYGALSGGLHTTTLAGHFEVAEADWLTVTSSAGVQLESFGDDVGFAELILRLYPHRRWMISPGASYAASNLKQTRADILIRGEHAAPLGSAATLGIWAQYGGNLYTRASAGLTLYFDGWTYAERDRRDALYSARFD
jgi:hypothetical protein